MGKNKVEDSQIKKKTPNNNKKKTPNKTNPKPNREGVGGKVGVCSRETKRKPAAILRL